MGSLLGALSGFLEIVQFVMGKVEEKYIDLHHKYKKDIEVRRIHDNAVLLENVLAIKNVKNPDKCRTEGIKLLKRAKFFQISHIDKSKLKNYNLMSQEAQDKDKDKAQLI
jgi:hypothetical protein